MDQKSYFVWLLDNFKPSFAGTGVKAIFFVSVCVHVTVWRNVASQVKLMLHTEFS